MPVLTSLRFFAAAVVVATHLEPGRFESLPSSVVSLLESGYQAVTFFFVLSGFILTYVYAGARDRDPMASSPRQFLGARFARIGPAYYVALLLMLPAFVYAFMYAHIVPQGEFIGAMLSSSLSLPSPLRRGVAFLLCAGALLFLLGQRKVIPAWLSSDVTLVPIYAGLIFSGAGMGGTLMHILARPALVLLGEASYAIYIVHGAILFWWRKTMGAMLSLDPAWQAGIESAAVVLFSLAVFLWVEVPLRRRVTKRISTMTLGHGARYWKSQREKT